MPDKTTEEVTKIKVQYNNGKPNEEKIKELERILSSNKAIPTDACDRKVDMIYIIKEEKAEILFLYQIELKDENDKNKYEFNLEKICEEINNNTDKNLYIGMIGRFDQSNEIKEINEIAKSYGSDKHIEFDKSNGIENGYYGSGGIFARLHRQMQMDGLKRDITRNKGEFKKLKKWLKGKNDDDKIKLLKSYYERDSNEKGRKSKSKIPKVNKTLIDYFLKYFYLKKIFEKSNIYLYSYDENKTKKIKFNDIFDENLDIKNDVETYKEYSDSPGVFKLFAPEGEKF